MNKLRKLGIATLCPLALINTAHAAPVTLALTPGNMLAQTHSHAIILSITGTYQQLSGTLNYDPAAKTCRINVTFIVRSLTAPNAFMRSQTMSKGFLDPADYPQTRYTGTCEGGQLVGNLSLRGQTHPFNMRLTYEGTDAQPTAIHAEGTLNRYEWGVNGLGMTVGKNIRVTNDISLTGKPPIPPG
jgi:polyisoprenoid-binding protein YceI